MASPQNKLSLGEKLGYALGDAAANFVLQMQLAFLMHFYTDVYGIAPFVVGVILATSHVVNACNDLVMGALSDRTQTRWGKFRPWIFWSSLPLGLASYLVFAAPDLGSTGKIVYAVITLNLMIIAYGANNIPYSALGGVISDDPDERVSVASWRMSFAMLAALFVLAYTRDMVKYFGGDDAIHGYRMTMVIWASLAVLCSLATFFMTKERIVAVQTKNSSLRDDLAALFANQAWQVLALSSFLIYICLGIRGSVTLYYFQYALDREDLFGWFNAIGMAAAMIGIYFSKSLVERYGKRDAFCGGMVLSAMLAAVFYFLRGDQPYLILGLQFVFQVAFGATVPIMWGMIADVADFSEWRSGRRITALTFAATLFFFKIGQGIGQALTAWLLAVVGYQPNTVQTPAAMQGIRMLISIVPAGMFLLGGLVILWYVITRTMEQEMTADLRARREQLALAEI